MPALPYWLFPGDDRPTEEIDDEIAEELQLHLDLLAEEQERRGLAPEEAKQKAAERFGDFNQLLRRCRREKQGDVPMLKRVQVILTGLLAIGLAATALGWKSTEWELSRLQTRLQNFESDYGLIRGTLGELVSHKQFDKQVEKSKGEPTNVDSDPIHYRFDGTLHDANGELIRGAFCQLSLRSWFPDGYFVPSVFEFRFDDQGNQIGSNGFVMPVEGSYAWQMTAFAFGYAFESIEYPKAPTTVAPEPYSFELQRADRVLCLVEDADGQPVAAEIVPESRTTAAGQKHVMQLDRVLGSEYSTPVRQFSGPDGLAAIQWFQEGDIATVLVKPVAINEEWRRVSFKVAASKTPIKFQLPSAVLPQS